MEAMNESDRKLLTEYMGECWHEDLADENGRCPICDKGLAIPIGAGRTLMSWNRRTFDNGNDLYALKEKIAEKGEWNEFKAYTTDQWFLPDTDKTLSDWLFTIPRFFELVIAWRKETEDDRQTPGKQQAIRGTGWGLLA